MLPGIDHYLEPVLGLEQGGRLCVRGPNVMLGYLHAERPGVLDRPSTPRGAGWYDIGDIVTIDADGFITIEGRARRFAKIGAEMISLGVVEQLAERVWPDARHAVLNLPDARRGEQLVLLTERSQAQRADLLARARAEGVSELHVPKKIITVEAIPLLGAGKTNYEAARALVERELGRLGARAS